MDSGHHTLSTRQRKPDARHETPDTKKHRTSCIRNHCTPDKNIIVMAAKTKPCFEKILYQAGEDCDEPGQAVHLPLLGGPHEVLEYPDSHGSPLHD
jgi:hypothetical protein